MADQLAPKNTRTQSERIRNLITHNHYYSDSLNTGSNSTNYAWNQAFGDSSPQLGDRVYENRAACSSTEPIATSRQYLQPRDHQYLPSSVSQPQLLLGSGTASRSHSADEPVDTLAGAKLLWKGLQEELSPEEGSIIAPSKIESLHIGIDEPSLFGRQQKGEQKYEQDYTQEQSNISDEEQEGNQEEWLNMASSSSGRPVIIHKETPNPDSNTWMLMPGHVITVFEYDNTDISLRSMIVLAKSVEHALQCVSLCRHGDLYSITPEFLETHVPVYSSEKIPKKADPNFDSSAIISFETSNAELCKQRCFVMCQHVWTIRSNVSRWSRVGHVTNFKDFLPVFLGIQEKLYNGVKADVGVEDNKKETS